MFRPTPFLVAVGAAAALLVTACSQEGPTEPDAPGGEVVFVKVGTLKVTPPRLDFTALGEKASLNATTTAAGPVTLDVSTPACVSVTSRSPGKFTVESIASGSCTITIGDGTANQIQVPVQVQVVALVRGTLANGPFHTCGLTAAGKAYCWGANDRGQLGTAGNFQVLAPTTSPVPVDGDLVFTQLTAGPFNTCGLTAAGATYCWGDNASGMLGTSATPGANIYTPTLVASGASFVAIELGVAHVCGLTAAGVAYCWGNNSNGRLGRVTSGPSPNPTPEPVSTTLSFTAIEAGASHTCGLTGAGAAYCWGSNDKGQLGNPDNTGDFNSTNPVPSAVDGGLAFVSLSAAGQFTCGLNAAGSAYCWGDNSSGALGNTQNAGQPLANPAPLPVSGGLTFTALASGGGHTCGLAGGGEVYCWGSNNNGQLGSGTNLGSTTPNPEPAPVSGVPPFISLTADGTQTCGVASSGAAYCWGNNFWGQLGVALNSGTSTPTPEPQVVSGGLAFAM
jgi:alpha-tubulin suppressor-like RCC1 family protein